MSNAHRIGVAAVIAASALWGTTGTAATFTSGVGPLAIGAAALGIGGLLQAMIALPALRAAATHLRRHLAVLAAGALMVAVYPLAFYSSMHLAGVAVGSVVSLASAPLASGLLERLVDHRPLNRSWMLAASLGVIGGTLLCLSGLHGPTASAANTAAGIALGLLAGATYAGYSWVVHRLIGSGVSRAASMGAVFGGGGILLLPVLLITGGPLLASTSNFLVATYMATIPMFLGYLLFGIGLARIPVSTATTVTLAEPAIAAVLAVLIVGERLTPTGWTGMGIIALVLVILAIWPSRGPRKPAPHSAMIKPRSGNPRGRQAIGERYEQSATPAGWPPGSSGPRPGAADRADTELQYTACRSVGGGI